LVSFVCIVTKIELIWDKKLYGKMPKKTECFSDMPKEIFLKDYKKPSFKIENVELVFELFEDKTIVTNTMKIVKTTQIKDITLHSIELELLGIWLDDKELDKTRYAYTDEKLKILNVPSSFVLKIKNKIFPHVNTELEGLYKSGSIFCTQNEPEGFRKITPYLDRPDIMSVFKTTIIADKKKYPVLLSNGNKLQCYDNFDGRHGVTWFDPHPKPSYLFALVAGDLEFINDSFTTMNSRHVELNIYCDKGNKNKCHHAMKSLKEAFVWDEQKYGREYDLEVYNIVAVDSFNMGAMENKGLNIFNSHYVLADENTATDNDFMGIQSVIAHEYFHNWTGNRITCRDWFQLTLKEGLTVFRDQCFSADMNSKEVQRIKDVKSLRQRQFVEDASATAHPIQPKSYISMNNFYTATVYEKGAEVIRMIHTLLGEEKFKKACDIYFDTFDGMAVTTDDFLWAMSEACDIDLSQFKLWYHQSGTPKLKVDENFQNKTYTLTLTQIIPADTNSKKQKAYFYPLNIALIDKNGKEILKKTLIISKEKEKFVFEGLQSKPYLSINRNFSAPIIIENNNSDSYFLMKHDTNFFTKYEATQNFAIQTLEQIMRGGDIDKKFIEAYGYVLDLDIELSYKALLLELPCVSAIMQRQNEIDFEPIYEAKDMLQKKLATIYKDKFLELYSTFHMPKNTNTDSISISKRAIKNRCLKMLCATKDEDIILLTKKQYEESLNMTDKIIALDMLENTSKAQAKKAMDDFYAKYKNNTLVMNKYFTILSSSSDKNVLKSIKQLEKDEAYDNKIPNLVRSLIGSFTRNYKYFHAKDGSGYRFIREKIFEIDKINPQMASSLGGAFKLYKKLNPINKELMKKELKTIKANKHLSKNTYEIINKIL